MGYQQLTENSKTDRQRNACQKRMVGRYIIQNRVLLELLAVRHSSLRQISSLCLAVTLPVLIISDHSFTRFPTAIWERSPLSSIMPASYGISRRRPLHLALPRSNLQMGHVTVAVLRREHLLLRCTPALHACGLSCWRGLSLASAVLDKKNVRR